MRRSLLLLLVCLTPFVVACGMQRPDRPVTTTPEAEAQEPQTPSSSPTFSITVKPTFGLGISPLNTPTPRDSGGRFTSPVNTPVQTPQRTDLRSPTLTPLPTFTSLPTSTPIPIRTSTPIPRPAPSFTSIPLPPPTEPPTATPIPPTPTVPPYPFVVENAYGTPDCSQTLIYGYVIDKSRRGLSGYKVRVGNVGGSWSTLSDATGSDGKYSVRLALTPTAGRWYTVIEESSNNYLSPKVEIETTATDCGADQSGIQVGRIDFRKDY